MTNCRVHLSICWSPFNALYRLFHLGKTQNPKQAVKDEHYCEGPLQVITMQWGCASHRLRGSLDDVRHC